MYRMNAELSAVPFRLVSEEKADFQDTIAVLLPLKIRDSRVSPVRADRVFGNWFPPTLGLSGEKYTAE